MIEPAQEWLQLAGTMSIFTNHNYAAPEKAAVTGFHVHLYKP